MNKLKRFCWFLCIPLFLVGAVSIRAEEVFVRVPLWGGEIHYADLCISSPTVIYAGSGEGGLWVSKDAGESWQETTFRKTTNKGTERFAVHPDSANVILVAAERGGGGGLYRSEDYGQTWTEIPGFYRYKDAVCIRKLTFSPKEHNTVYLLGNDLGISDGVVYRSIDSGKTWTKTNFTSFNKFVIDLCVDKDGVIYVCSIDTPVKMFPNLWDVSRGWLYKSTNNGVTWTPIDNFNSQVLYNKVPLSLETSSDVVAVYVPRFIWTSRDGFVSFSKVPEIDYSGNISFAISTDGSSIFFDFNNKIYKSTYTAGIGWSESIIVSTTVLDGSIPFKASRILIDPINPENIYVADGKEYAFLKSTDTAKTWYISNKGLAGVVVRDGCKGPQGYLYAMSAGCIYKSTDVGKSWVKVYSSKILDAFWWSTIATNPDPAKDYVYVGMYDRILRSIDGGQTWDEIKLLDVYHAGYSLLPAKDMVFRQDNPAIGYIAFSVGSPTGETKRKYIYKTTDYGKTWSELNLETMSVQSLAIDPLDQSILYIGLGEVVPAQDRSVAFGGLWKIVDRGGADLSLSRIGLDDKIPYRIAIDTTNPNVIYAACIEDLNRTYGPVYVSQDKGITWNKMSLGDPYKDFWTSEGGAIDIAYSYPAIYFCNFSGIHASINNGITFERIVDSRDVGHIQCLILGSLYAGTNTGLWKLTKTFPILTYTVEKPKVYAFPNPFNASRGYTVLKYFVPQGQTVTSLKISVYNIAGELVYEFPEKTNLSGGYAYYYAWDGRNQHKEMCARGVYIFVFKSNLDVTKTKVVLTK